MKVRDVMNINSIRILTGSTMSDAADLAAASNASGLFVVDNENYLFHDIYFYSFYVA